MVLAALGTAALGGLLTGIGQSQQGSALARAGEAARKNAEAAGQRLTTETRYTGAGVERLANEGRGLLDARVNAYGPGQREAYAAAVPQAAGITSQGAGQLSSLIRRRPTFMNAGGGMGAQLAADRLNRARLAPGRTLRDLQLAQQLTLPSQQQAGLDYQVGMAGLGRQGQELNADQAFRRQGILGEYQLGQQAAGFQAQDAGSAGAGMSALGQFATGLAPGIAAAMARGPQSTPPTPAVIGNAGIAGGLGAAVQLPPAGAVGYGGSYLPPAPAGIGGLGGGGSYLRPGQPAQPGQFF